MVPSDSVVVELENGKSDTTNPLKRCYFAFQIPNSFTITMYLIPWPFPLNITCVSPRDTKMPSLFSEIH